MHRTAASSYRFTALIVLLISGPALADNARPVDAVPTDARPMNARPAATASGFQFEGFVDYFDGLNLQEARDFQGWTAGLDFTLPFRDTMQLRFLLPLRTDAEGTLVSNGDDIDIEGWGGTFDFATLFFEHQIMGVDGGPDRMSYFLGVGIRTAVLNTGTPDKYNHTGRSVHAGLRYQRQLDGGGQMFLEGELRSFEESDDLNPASLTDDRFFLTTLTGAWLAKRRGSVTPGVELKTEIVSDYVAASIIPELIIRTTDKLDLKFGIAAGLSKDAPDWGAQFQFAVTL